MTTFNSAGQRTTREARVGDYRRGGRMRTTPAGTWFPAIGPNDQPAGLLLVHPGVDLRVLRPTLARLADLALPGVLPAHPELTHQAGRNWLIVDAAPSPVLADLLDDGPHRSPGNAAALLRELAGTLIAAHRVGVVHGRLAANSVVIGPRGTALLTEWATNAGASQSADIAAWTQLARLFAERWCADAPEGAAALARAVGATAGTGLAAGIEQLRELAGRADQGLLADAAAGRIGARPSRSKAKRVGRGEPAPPAAPRPPRPAGTAASTASTPAEATPVPAAQAPPRPAEVTLTEVTPTEAPAHVPSTTPADGTAPTRAVPASAEATAASAPTPTAPTPTAPTPPAELPPPAPAATPTTRLTRQPTPPAPASAMPTEAPAHRPPVHHPPTRQPPCSEPPPSAPPVRPTSPPSAPSSPNPAPSASGTRPWPTPSPTLPSPPPHPPTGFTSTRPTSTRPPSTRPVPTQPTTQPVPTQPPTRPPPSQPPSRVPPEPPRRPPVGPDLPSPDVLSPDVLGGGPAESVRPPTEVSPDQPREVPVGQVDQVGPADPGGRGRPTPTPGFQIVLIGLLVIALAVASGMLYLRIQRANDTGDLAVERVDLRVQKLGTICMLYATLTTNGRGGPLTYRWASDQGLGPTMSVTVGAGQNPVMIGEQWFANPVAPDPLISIQLLTPTPTTASAQPAATCH